MKLLLIAGGLVTGLALAACGASSGEQATPSVTQNAVHVNKGLVTHKGAVLPQIWIGTIDQNHLLSYRETSGSPAFNVGGSNTLLNGPRSVSADNSTGKIYVANTYDASGPWPVLAFSNSANGNVAPVQKLNSSSITSEYLQLALDSSEDIWVGQGGEDSTYTPALLEFAAGAHGSNVTPINVINGGNTTLFNVLAIAIDSSGNVYALAEPFSGGPEIAEFAAGASGNVAPTRVIQGAHTGFKEPFQIAVDSSGDVYVTDASVASVKEFTPSQSGNVYPHAVIQGSSTKLVTGNGPLGITFDDDNNIYVTTAGVTSTSSSSPAILEFAAGATGNVSPIRTITNGVKTAWTITICEEVPPCESGDGALNRRIPSSR